MKNIRKFIILAAVITAITFTACNKNKSASGADAAQAVETAAADAQNNEAQIPLFYAASNVRLRSEPDTSKDNRIANILKGDSVELLEVGKTENIDDITAPWFRVKTANGIIGWVFSGYLQATAEPPGGGGPAKIRLSNVPVTGTGTASVYDFGYITTGVGEVSPLGHFITGTPKVEVNNGMLTLELDALYPDAFVLEILKNNDNTVTPTDAKGYTPYFFTANLYSPSTNSYSLKLTSPNPGGAFLLYADKDVTINGRVFGVNFISISLAKGWNFVTFNGDYDVLAASKTQPAGYTWTVEDNGIFGPPDN